MLRCFFLAHTNGGGGETHLFLVSAVTPDSRVQNRYIGGHSHSTQPWKSVWEKICLFPPHFCFKALLLLPFQSLLSFTLEKMQAASSQMRHKWGKKGKQSPSTVILVDNSPEQVFGGIHWSGSQLAQCGQGMALSSSCVESAGIIPPDSCCPLITEES